MVLVDITTQQNNLAVSQALNAQLGNTPSNKGVAKTPFNTPQKPKRVGEEHETAVVPFPLSPSQANPSKPLVGRALDLTPLVHPTHLVPPGHADQKDQKAAGAGGALNPATKFSLSCSEAIPRLVSAFQFGGMITGSRLEKVCARVVNEMRNAAADNKTDQVIFRNYKKAELPNFPKTQVFVHKKGAAIEVRVYTKLVKSNPDLGVEKKFAPAMMLTIGAGKHSVKLAARLSLKQGADIQRAIGEAAFQASFDVPFICKVYDYTKEAFLGKDNRNSMVRYDEWCNEGDLFTYNQDKLRPILDDEKLNGDQKFEKISPLLTNIHSGLRELHSRGFLHRDLKPENCLVSSDGGQVIAKLTDFGSVKKFGPPKLKTERATPNFLSPQLFDSFPVSGVLAAPLEDKQLLHNESPDMWALGCLVHDLYTGDVPRWGTLQTHRTLLYNLLVEMKQFPLPEEQLKIGENQTIAKEIVECTNLISNLDPVDLAYLDFEGVENKRPEINYDWNQAVEYLKSYTKSFTEFVRNKGKHIYLQDFWEKLIPLFHAYANKLSETWLALDGLPQPTLQGETMIWTLLNPRHNDRPTSEVFGKQMEQYWTDRKKPETAAAPKTP